MVRFKTISTAALLLTTAFAAPAMAQDQPGAGTQLRLAQPTWDTGWFYTEIFKQMFAELGYSVDEAVTLDNPAFYQSVGYGDVDLWLDGWFPMHQAYEPIYGENAVNIGPVVSSGALEGYLVDKATAEELDITSLEDFRRDEVKAAFDRNGDGMADMVSCPPGWNCELTIEHQMQAYDLTGDINLIKAGYAPGMADAVAAYGNGEPIFFYTWTPNWTVNELVPGEDVVWIEVPEIALPEDQMYLADAATREGVVGCVNDPCMLGFPANSIDAVVNTGFLEANPAVGALLEAAEIPIEDVYAQNAAMNDGDDDIEAQAAEWIANNRALVDEWLETARSAAAS